MTAPANIVASLAISEVSMPYVKSTKPFTLAQYGHRPELSYAAERDALSGAMRMRRWWVAYESTCQVAGVAVGTVYVPCAHCGHNVDAWRADVDHLVSRHNGGVATHGALALTHPACNRQTKGWDDASAATVAAYAATNNTFPRVTTDAFKWFWVGAERADMLGQSVRRGARDFD